MHPNDFETLMDFQLLLWSMSCHDIFMLSFEILQMEEEYLKKITGQVQETYDKGEIYFNFDFFHQCSLNVNTMRSHQKDKLACRQLPIKKYVMNGVELLPKYGVNPDFGESMLYGNMAFVFESHFMAVLSSTHLENSRDQHLTRCT